MGTHGFPGVTTPGRCKPDAGTRGHSRRRIQAGMKTPGEETLYPTKRRGHEPKARKGSSPAPQQGGTRRPKGAAAGEGRGSEGGLPGTRRAWGSVGPQVEPRTQARNRERCEGQEPKEGRTNWEPPTGQTSVTAEVHRNREMAEAKKCPAEGQFLEWPTRACSEGEAGRKPIAERRRENQKTGRQRTGGRAGWYRPGQGEPMVLPARGGRRQPW